MKKYLLMGIGVFSMVGLVVYGGGQLGSLPAGAVRFTVAAGTSSYAPVDFSSVPSGHMISNANYKGWCVQYHVLINKGPVYSGNLYDTYAALPAHLQNIPWGKVNYVLNHKQGSVQDVQNAVWVSLGQSFDGAWTTNAQAMVDGAEQFGAAFVPSAGQVKAVIVDPVETVQRLVCEVVCVEDGQPAPLPPPTLSGGEEVAGGFKFLVEGADGSCVIEVSNDLVDWRILGTVEIAAGSVEFTDVAASTGDTRYYRARRE